MDILSKTEFRKFKLQGKKQISHNVFLYRFALPDAAACLNLPTGKHIKLCITVDGKEEQRSYTPVSLPSDQGKFDLLVKVYPQGKMSNHINNMNIHDEILIKGPVGIYLYEENKYKHIVMIAGGVGITPMLQIIRAILSNSNDKTKISLYFFNTEPKDLLVKEELDPLKEKNPEQFEVIYSVSKVPENATWKHHVGRVSDEHVIKMFPEYQEGMFGLVCGPQAFEKASKTALEQRGFPSGTVKVP